MLENCDKIIHLRFNFDACPMHSPFGFVHLTHQNLSAHALFCHNSLAKVNTQSLNYNSYTMYTARIHDTRNMRSRAHALFLYRCTPRTFEHLAQCVHVHQLCIGLIQLLHRYLYFVGKI